MPEKRPPIILTVAGSDSGGGAGIQADLKTIAVLGGYGATVLTALTAQNSVGVQGVHNVPPSFVASQFESVVGDFKINAVKTGMLATGEIIEVVASHLRDSGITNLVVDPVMISTTGHSLIDRGAVQSLVKSLFPLALIITPNLHEASALLGRKVTTVEEMEKAARDLLAMGPGAVLLKGGHLEDSATDYFACGGGGRFLVRKRVATTHAHGSGCVLSAAIATLLGGEFGLEEAVVNAKAFITGAIEGAFQVGHGSGPVNPLAGGWKDGPKEG